MHSAMAELLAQVLIEKAFDRVEAKPVVTAPELPKLTVESVIQADQVYSIYRNELMGQFKEQQPALAEFLESAFMFHDESEQVQIIGVVAMICKAFSIQMGAGEQCPSR